MKTNNTIAFFALIVSLIALYFTFDQNRKYNLSEEKAYNLNEKLEQLDSQFKNYSLKPILQFDYEEDADGNHLYLENMGIGPAIIVEMHTYYNITEVQSWEDLDTLVPANDPFFENDLYPSHLLIPQFSIASGQKKEVMGFKLGQSEEVSTTLDDISIDIVYKGMYSDTFHLSYGQYSLFTDS